LQTVLYGLQLFAQGFAFLLQGTGLLLVVGIQRGIYGFRQFVQLGLQLLGESSHDRGSDF